MSTLMQLLIWSALQMGLSVCEVAPDHEDCETTEEPSSPDIPPKEEPKERDLNEPVKIYNGF